MITVKTLREMIEHLPDDSQVIIECSSDIAPGEAEPYLIGKGYYSKKLRTFWDDFDGMAKDMGDQGLEPFDTENAVVIYA